MKVIETEYNNYRFRSRLEARWAVFFDRLGVRYEYEKEGYDLDGIWYLPDFWLPDQQCWIEIKGGAPTEDEKKKAGLLAVATGQWVNIFSGDISPETVNVLAFDSRLPKHTGFQEYVDWAIERRDTRLLTILIDSTKRVYWADVIEQAQSLSMPIIRGHNAYPPYSEQARIIGACTSCPRIAFGYKGGYHCNEDEILACDKCGRIARFCDGTQHRVPDLEGSCDVCEENAYPDAPRMLDAYKAARQARF